MLRSRWLLLSTALCAGAMNVALTESNAVLAGPPSIMNMFQERSSAASDENLALKDEHGPWLILAMTLSGDNAETKAITLAKELRSLLRTDVYIHRKEFDYSQPLAQASLPFTEGNQQKVYNSWIQHAHAVHEKNYAVLVGNYSSSDDHRIAEMLKRVKTAHPKCLEDKPDGKDSSADASKVNDPNWLIATKRMLLWQKNEESAKKGKMGAAFVTRNPLLPEDYFRNAVDEFVVKLNEPVEYSLLDCPGRYTVRVATFNGRTITELATGLPSDKKEEEITDALVEAGEKANYLTTALRAQGVEAFEFHDRKASYVTIGSFDSLGEVSPTGQFVYNPEMVAIMNQWCGYEMLTVKDPKTGFVKTTPSCKTLKNVPSDVDDKFKKISFDVEGKFISVPRSTASKLYGKSLLGKSRVNQ